MADEHKEPGTVKWFNTNKGFGFIMDEAGKDVFVHYSQISQAGFKTLTEGDKVSFVRVSSPKGFQALNVQRRD